MIKEIIFSLITLNKFTEKFSARTVAKGCPNIVQHKKPVNASAVKRTNNFCFLENLVKNNLKLSIIIID